MRYISEKDKHNLFLAERLMHYAHSIEGTFIQFEGIAIGPDAPKELG
jgi:hypothetical protein